MKTLIDFLPIILFFISYKFYGIYTAVYVMIVASVIQVIGTRLMTKKFEKAQVIGLVAMVVFGGLTLWLRSPAFIMWKVSAINLLFAVILLGSLWFSKKPLIAYLLDKQVSMTKQAWIGLNHIWTAMFIVTAIVNSYFVIIALNLREKLITMDIGFQTADLQTITCQIELCTQAKLAEQAWVNFKLFGALGITLLFLMITAFYIHKYNTHHES